MWTQNNFHMYYACLKKLVSDCAMEYCWSYISFNIAHDNSDRKAFDQNLEVFCEQTILGHSAVKMHECLK